MARRWFNSNSFGADLFAVLVGGQTPPTNLVFSPASIAIGLSMVLAGAEGATASQLAIALHIEDIPSLPGLIHELMTALAARTRTVAVPGGDPADVLLAIANSLWVQDGLPIEPTFVRTLGDGYDTMPQTVDYATDPDAARRNINAWVDTATKNRIPELVPEGAVSAETQLALVNAVYMKAPWETPFSERRTAPAEFTTMAGATALVPMMHVTDRFDLVAAAGVRAVVLPYLGDELSMVIVLPDEGRSLATPAVALAALATLDLATATRTRIALSVPTFDIETSVGLADALMALGVVDVFDDVTADLAGIASVEPPLYVGAVIHQANITVDEHGTEAAAATAVMAAGAGLTAQPNPVDFTVDRPFVFAIRDVPTGTILFLGQIGDPSLRRN